MTVSTVMLLSRNCCSSVSTHSIVYEIAYVVICKIYFSRKVFSACISPATVIGFDSDNYEIFEGFEVNAVLSVPVEILNGTLASGVIYPVQVATEGLEDQPNVATGIETTQSCW